MFVFQGARGFPGTPGLPGIKGHRVSVSNRRSRITTLNAQSFHPRTDRCVSPNEFCPVSL